MARTKLPGSWPGLLIQGNIDIDFRATLHVPNPFQGGFSSVDSTSYTVHRHDDKWARFVPFRRIPVKYQSVEVLVPSVVRRGNRWVVLPAGDGPWNTYTQTRKFLGMFDNIAHANRYANALHLEQARAGAKSRSRG